MKYSIFLLIPSLFYATVVNQTYESTCNSMVSPVSLTSETYDCHYIEKFRFQFPDKLLSIIGTINSTDGHYVFNQIPNVNVALKSEEEKRQILNSKLVQVRISTPAEHRLAVMNNNAQYTDDNTLELQLTFQIVNSEQIGDAKQVGVSFIASSYEEPHDYHPDASTYINPFYTIGSLSNITSTSVVEINFRRIFDGLTKYYHQWMSYEGTSLTDCTIKTIWYVNKQLFHVDQELIDRYRVGPSNNYVAVNENQVINYDQQLTKSVYRVNANRNDSNSAVNIAVLTICWDGFEQTIMRQNYGLWLFVTLFLVWWIVDIYTENDPPEAFMDELRENQWTAIPFYSVYKVSSDIFFTKLSRYTNWLTYFSWQVLVISILYAQFSNQGKYGVQDAIVFWYALVALLCSWPISYFFGAIMYNTRESLKDKYRLQIEWKKIPNKNSREAQDLIVAIDAEEDRIYTYYFIYYLLVVIFFIFCFFCTVWQCTFLSRYQQDLWVATIFITLGLDLLVDIVVAVIPGSTHLTKYRGYYYDFELGHLFKNVEE